MLSLLPFTEDQDYCWRGSGGRGGLLSKPRYNPIIVLHLMVEWCVLCAVPFRDSVLTKLLQNALGGNSKTVMVGVHDLISSHTSLTRSWVGFCSGAVGLFWCVFLHAVIAG